MADPRVKSRRATRPKGITVAEEERAASPLSGDAFDYTERNHAAWEIWARDYATVGRTTWGDEDLRWGIWDTPESELQLLDGLPPNSDVIELGCGTGEISASLARHGFRPVAVDFSRRQLETADRLQREHGLFFPLIHADAENVPYDRESFDVAVSEYGASLWCDPRRWLREAHRLLRSEGKLIFVTNGAILIACTPPDALQAGDRLVRGYFSSQRIEYPIENTVEFHPTHGTWVRLLRAAGFVLESLVEVRPPHGAKPRLQFASVEWARQWPSEEIWVARKAA